MSRDGSKLDNAIAVLEALASQLETTPASELPAALVAAQTRSAAVVDEALAPAERDEWHASLTAAISGGEYAEISSVADTGKVDENSITKDSEKVKDVEKRQAVMGGASCAECGIVLRKKDEPKTKSCVHRCGVLFCGKECWYNGRRRHAEQGCDVLRRRQVLKRIGLDPAARDGELF
jgi:predicted Zn-ribbon and HTH transcriptional regulator